ncbi:MAG: GGDEF domain-containing protein [Sulfurimonas sp.]|nr:GGDEF domain-containing protein [Sulfurimonas sp.]
MDREVTTHYVKKVITRRYVVALAIIAFLSTLAFLMLHLVLKDTQSIAYVVNISGKQRMLSQHIALDVQKVYNCSRERDFEGVKVIKKRLERLSDEMLHANEMLSSGKLSPTEEIKLTYEIQNLYFTPTGVAQRVENYVKAAKELLHIEESMEMEASVRFFNTESNALLQDLNKIVEQYQKEGEADLRKIQRVENIIYFVTLIALLLEVIFIFQPMARKLIELTKDKEIILGDLQHQVEMRTLHLERANEQLSKLASHDPLTGLLNRLGLEADMSELARHYREHKAPFAVILFDVDWFKSVNDTYGHDMGDFVLCELAMLLKEHFRHEDKIYRAGGEEFLALLSRVSVEESLLIAQKIRQVVEAHLFQKEGIAIHMTISAGVYHTDVNSGVKNYKNIYKLTDMALYRAKEEGRNRVVLAQEAIKTS